MQAGPQRQDRHRRARVHAERSTRDYELAVEEPMNRRVAVAFAEIAVAI
jgi:hypothetical protein